MKSVVRTWFTALVLGLGAQMAVRAQVLTPDVVAPDKKSLVTATLYTDGNGGVRIKNEEAQLFMSGDVIERVEVIKASNASVCTQRSNAEKRTGSRSCGFLGLKRCPVYNTRVQECAVQIQCDYLLWRAGEAKTLCNEAIGNTVVAAPSDATAVFKTEICKQQCNKDKSWTVTGSAGEKKPPAGMRVGIVTYHIERSN